MRDIRLDPKHGLNPSLLQCFVCGEAESGVALFGQLNAKTRAAFKDAGLSDGSAEAPRMVCLSHEPCAKCREYMQQGVILISVDESKSTDMQNPVRTGGWCVVRDEMIKRLQLQPAELEASILHKRMAFLPDDVWDALGLPRGAVTSGE